MTQTIPNRQAELQTLLEQATWYRALSLSERVDSLPTATSQVADLALGQRRLEKWKQQPVFAKETDFVERLALDHVNSEEDLIYLLGETDEALQARTLTSPVWLSRLREAFLNVSLTERFAEHTTLLAQPLSAFLRPILPLLAQGYQDLLTGIEALAQHYPSAPFEPANLATLLFGHIRAKLLPVVMKTFALELNIARLEGKLRGETTEERFTSFIDQLSEPEAILHLLENYPVLARQLVEIIEQYVEYALEMLSHLYADWPDLCSQLIPASDHGGTLVEIKGGAGDTHRQGRSVVLLTFHSGFKLLYKPRSLALDVHFQALLDWLNTQGKHPVLRAVKVLNQGTYGWSEYIPVQACHSPAEIRRFYERLGCYLALLYTFQSTDFHFENIIASGEYPMLIDLESLLQPLVSTNNEQNLPLSVEVLATSVLRSGILPKRIHGNADAAGIDISGLGGRGGQLTPQPVAMWEAMNTDQMHLKRERIAITEQQNRPTLAGQTVNMLDYMDEVIIGFTSMYHLLVRHRVELLSRFLPSLAQDEIRIILRPTRTYGQFLHEGQHPTLLHNALDRERFLDRIWGARQLGRQVIRAERLDMFINDIPLFTTSADARYLQTSKGERIADFFRASGLETARQKMQQLDETDLARQTWIIRASFASILMGEAQSSWKATCLQSSDTPLTRERLLQAARAIGDRLCTLAFCGETEVSWLSLHLVRERQWDLSITDWSLYSGVSGITLYLAYLGMICGEARYTELAQQALTGIQQSQEKLPGDLLTIGAFNGWGSLLYLYTHLGVLWADPSLLQAATSLVDLVLPYIEKDTSFDVISGDAGLLYCLLGLYRVAPSPHILQAAIRCGRHLQTHAVQQARGLGWLTTLTEERPLAGFSHGVAGIALALLQLADLSGETCFAETAQAAFEYERSIFSPALQNWPDLRASTSGGQTSGMTTWCHGAPGIGLARLASLAYLDTAEIRAEIAVALQTTRRQGFGMNHSLCHGDLGNLETLLLASLIQKDSVGKEEVENLAAMILDSLERQGWCTGVPLSVETPGLMTGIAGIGYELLRLAAPERVPSVLLLEAPRLR